ncbi:hypothetical protein PFISCL1PPCAC_9310 [Pristionchus fissidentatus]|uniref:Galectin n=1 Tax=Pristionchus fissidentatus TaxID=1538716 RepID=A0AAV5VIC5_9BILA|nr:hypothetical protein PFISCL1PPCAC_9310 [Pristionchus fissidentatus]
MILPFWILAFLSSTGLAMKDKIFKLDKVIPDGTLITVFFKSGGDHSDHRFDIDFVKDDPNYNHIKILWGHTAHTSTRMNYQWIGKEMRDYMWIDTYIEEVKWWRVDVIKYDQNRINVCIQGYCFLDAFKFSLSLDNMDHIRIRSDNIYFDSLIFSMRTPSGNIKSGVVTTQLFKDNIKNAKKLPPITYFDLPKFERNDRLEMSVYMQSWAKDSDQIQPMLMFVEKDTYNIIFRLFHEDWRYDSVLWLGGTSDSHKVKCDNGNPRGNLKHLIIEQIGCCKIKVHVLYKNNGIQGVTCEITLDNANQLLSPMQIMGNEGALPLIINHIIPEPTTSITN